MPPKRSNDKSAYRSKIKSDLKELGNGGIQATNVDLAKVDIQKTKIISVLSEDVQIVYVSIEYKEILCFKRTISLLMKSDIDMSATTSETAEVITDSDEEVGDLIDVEKEV